jgi:hypothetical protein
MKKLWVILIVLAFASPAMADVAITGSYDASALTADNVTAQNLLSDSLDDADKVSYLHQRFRVGAKIKVADNVSGNLRFDFAEGIWGQDQGFDAVRASDTSELQVDRAYVDVNTAYVGIRAGLQFVFAGQTQVFRDNAPALVFNIKTGSPVGIRLGYIKASESTGTGLLGLSDDDDLNKDTDRYLANLGVNLDAVKANLFYVTQQDGSTDGVTDFKDQPTVMGLQARTKIGPVAISGELAQFGGDDGNGTDYVGTQFNVNGMMKLSDALSLGVDLFYSSAADPSAGEAKITFMGDPLAAYDVKNGGTMGWDMLTYGRNTAQLFTSVPPGGLLPGDIFDPFNTNAGSMGMGVGCKFVPLDLLTLIGQLHYMTAANNDLDGVSGEFSSGYNLLLAAVFQLAPKTSLHATYHMVSADFEDLAYDVEDAYVYGLRLHVAF